MKSPYIKKWAVWFVGSGYTDCFGVYDTRKDAKRILSYITKNRRYKYFIRHCFMIVPKKGETK